MASRPNFSAFSEPPPSAPAVVPSCQATYRIAEAPKRNQRSKAPSSSIAIAHEASTTGWPCAARLSAPPGNDGAKAMPIARNLEFIRPAASTAGPRPPPAATIDTDANCAEPAKTTTDMTIAAAAEKPASRARTPNEADSRRPAAAYGTPARTPARHEARRSEGTASMRVQARSGPNGEDAPG